MLIILSNIFLRTFYFVLVNIYNDFKKKNNDFFYKYIDPFIWWLIKTPPVVYLVILKRNFTVKIKWYIFDWYLPKIKNELSYYSMILRYYYTWTNPEIDERIKTYKSEFIKFVIDIWKIIFFITVPIIIILYIYCHIQSLYYLTCFAYHFFMYFF